MPKTDQTQDYYVEINSESDSDSTLTFIETEAEAKPLLDIADYPTLAGILHAPPKWAKKEVHSQQRLVYRYLRKLMVLGAVSMPVGFLSSRAFDEFEFSDAKLKFGLSLAAAAITAAPTQITVDYSLRKVQEELSRVQHKARALGIGFPIGLLMSIHFGSYISDLYEHNFLFSTPTELAWTIGLGLGLPILSVTNAYFAYLAIEDYRRSRLYQGLKRAYINRYGSIDQKNMLRIQDNLSEILHCMQAAMKHLDDSRIERVHQLLCESEQPHDPVNTLVQIIRIIHEEMSELPPEETHQYIDNAAQLLGFVFAIVQTIPFFNSARFGIHHFCDLIGIRDTEGKNLVYQLISPFPIGSHFLTGALYCPQTVHHVLMSATHPKCNKNIAWALTASLFLSIAPSLTSFALTLSNPEGNTPAEYVLAYIVTLASFLMRFPILIEEFLNKSDKYFARRYEHSAVSHDALTTHRYRALKREDVRERIVKTNLESDKLNPVQLATLNDLLTRERRLSFAARPQ